MHAFFGLLWGCSACRHSTQLTAVTKRCSSASLFPVQALTTIFYAADFVREPNTLKYQRVANFDLNEICVYDEAQYTLVIMFDK
jgi:hypothetical protein